MARIQPSVPSAATRARSDAGFVSWAFAASLLVGCQAGEDAQVAMRDSSVTPQQDSGAPSDASPPDDDAMDGGAGGEPVTPLPPGEDAEVPATPSDASTVPGNDASVPRDAAVPDAGPSDAGPQADAGADAGSDEPVAPGSTPETLVPMVLKRYPHDKQAFTQGLLWSQGRMFESTGLEGQSTLREVTLETGAVLRRLANDADLFAEGLALVGTELIQLTWTEKRALVWNRDDFAKVREYTYTGEGWGLCYDGRELMMSSGNDKLTIRDPKTFAVLREVPVTRAGRAQRNLNELECVAGRVYANVWQTDEIVRIDPRTGAIDAVINAAGLLSAQEKQGADVLNGIAFMPESAHFLLTGKRWPTIFEVVFQKSP